MDLSKQNALSLAVYIAAAVAAVYLPLAGLSRLVPVKIEISHDLPIKLECSHKTKYGESVTVEQRLAR